MQWREFFDGKDEDEDDEEEIAVTSTPLEDRILKDQTTKTNLPRGHASPRELQNCIAATQYDILSVPLKKVRPNLTREMEEGMEELNKMQKDRTIKITRSDKAGGWVVVDFEPYKAAGDMKLREKFEEDGVEKPKYKKVDQATLKRQHKHLKKVVEAGVLEGFICGEDAKLAVPREPTSGRFYMNSKDHKQPDPTTGVPPWREIVSGSGSNTEGCSKIINHYLNPIMQDLKSYLQDSRHMLEKIKRINDQLSPLPDNTRMIAIDCVAMYPSIPPIEGIAATEEALRRTGMVEAKVKYLVKVLRLVLEYNLFEWDGQLFQQMFGTAIGTSCAPPYSCIYMGKLEEEAFKEWGEMNEDPADNIQEFVRLIDDGWGLWGGTVEKLKELLTFMNSRAPSINFTLEYTCPKNCEEKGQPDHECNDFLNYLDMKMFIDSTGQIQTDLYRKPHTKTQYLRPDSAHPRHVTANIPKSLVHRIARICSVPGSRELRLEELKQRLLERGYRPAQLNEALKFGLSLDREEAINKVSREDRVSQRVRYTTIYDPKMPDLPPILIKNWKVMVDTDQRLRKAFPAPPMVCLRRGKNLGEMLIRSKLPKLPSQTKTRAGTGHLGTGFRSCRGGRSCSLCPFSGLAADGKSVVQRAVIHHSGKVIEIKQNITCKDSFCLYILTCTKQGCLKQYAGMTTRPLYQRFAEHRDSAQDQGTTCSVGLHWQEPGHRLEHMELVGVEQMRGERDKIKLRQREMEMINEHDLIRKGLNINR